MREQQIEALFLEKLQALKYLYRPDIRDNQALERNFRDKFNALIKVTLTDSEFERLKGQMISPNVFQNAQHLRSINTLERDDGTPVNYTLVNLKDWCKNTYEVVSQLRINTASSHHRYDVILLINGIPAVQIELKAQTVSPRRAMEQIANYKKDLGNGYICDI